MAELGQQLWKRLERQAEIRMAQVDVGALTVQAQQENDPLRPYFEAGDRPGDRATRALDMGRVAAVERPLPGLEPTRQEQQAGRVRDAHEAHERLFPRETPEPVVGTPEQMSSARNAELFPRGTDNDNER